MFTEKDLVAGETVLVSNHNGKRVLYLGRAGLAHFISQDDEFKKANEFYNTIEDLNSFFTIEQPKSNAVPLEKKVYDFVPVRCRDNDKSEWENYRLVAVADNRWNGYQYFVIDEDGDIIYFRYCEFINQQ